MRTFVKLRHALRQFAKQNGEKAALDLLKRIAGTTELAAVTADDREKVIAATGITVSDDDHDVDEHRHVAFAAASLDDPTVHRDRHVTVRAEEPEPYRRELEQHSGGAILTEARIEKIWDRYNASKRLKGERDHGGDS